jgi:hypothetical protein
METLLCRCCPHRTERGENTSEIHAHIVRNKAMAMSTTVLVFTCLHLRLLLLIRM